MGKLDEWGGGVKRGTVVFGRDLAFLGSRAVTCVSISIKSEQPSGLGVIVVAVVVSAAVVNVVVVVIAVRVISVVVLWTWSMWS